MPQEARKYWLGLVMVGQFLDLFDEQLQGADAGERRDACRFRVGVRGAKVLADEFFPEFSTEDLVGLARGHVYLRLMIDGVVSRGFSATALPVKLLKTPSR
jgi:hypothetical protein